jgi:hypothetical protein
MTDSDFTDEQARKLAVILGDGLVAQLTNARYLASRGYPGAEDNVRRLEHAQRMRVRVSESERE